MGAWWLVVKWSIRVRRVSCLFGEPGKFSGSKGCVKGPIGGKFPAHILADADGSKASFGFWKGGGFVVLTTEKIFLAGQSISH